MSINLYSKLSGNPINAINLYETLKEELSLADHPGRKEFISRTVTPDRKSEDQRKPSRLGDSSFSNKTSIVTMEIKRYKVRLLGIAETSRWIQSLYTTGRRAFIS